MRQVDVFNGDADGLCSLHQLRLQHPVQAELVTGVKRDIKLLEQVQASTGDAVTVLDISLDSNRSGLMRLLDAGAQVEYFDHHHAGEVPRHPLLRTHLDLSANVCTGILVDRYLQGKFSLWAITAAFGDNLQQSALALAGRQGLDAAQTAILAQLGERLNYNGYGDTLEDLHFHPAQLYAEIKPYRDPFAFVAEAAAYGKLDAGLLGDTESARSLQPALQTAGCAVYLMPDQAWSRRISGVFANRLASESPQRAHAILTLNTHGDYTVSVRAPVANPKGADVLCLKFETGGGRKAAGGINRLPVARLDEFIAQFQQQYRGG